MKHTFMLTAGIGAAILTSLTLNARENTRLEDGWLFKRSCDPVPTTVTVPHCWNAIDGADGAESQRQAIMADGYWRGVGTYTRSLELKPETGKRYFLRCEGASIVSEIWFNGLKIGGHTGGFGAFCTELTPFLKSDDNTLTITVDNTFNKDIPPISGDFTMFGGLYRPVTIIETPTLCINPANTFSGPGVALVQRSLTDQAAELEVSADISGAVPLNSKVVMTITDRNQHLVAQAEIPLKAGMETIRQVKNTFKINNPNLWNGIKDPYLYTIKTEVVVSGESIDEVTRQWGFRNVEIDPKRGFVLNGRVMKVHGVNRHQDKEGKGWALSDADHEEDVNIMLEMGVDAWRAAHYPHSTKMYELCDKAGILVWAEIPLVNYCHDSDTHRANANYQLEEMIRQHESHPSIVMWSLSNELGNGPNSDQQDQLIKDLFEKCKKLDPTRYCVLAASRFRKENYFVEHIGFNIYPGWYGYKPSDMGKIIQNWCDKHPGMGISVSEYGAGGSIFAHDPSEKTPKIINPWHPEEYQTYAHEAHYKAIKESGPQCWGSFVWNMFDFAADHRREGDRRGMNDKGLVSYDRKIKKDVFYFYQANWTDKPMVYIASRRFDERSQNAFEMPFKVFSNCDSVELFLNDVSLGVKSPNDMKTALFSEFKLKAGEEYTVRVKGTKGKVTVTDEYEFRTK